MTICVCVCVCVFYNPNLVFHQTILLVMRRRTVLLISNVSPYCTNVLSQTQWPWIELSTTRLFAAIAFLCPTFSRLRHVACSVQVVSTIFMCLIWGYFISTFLSDGVFYRRGSNCPEITPCSSERLEAPSEFLRSHLLLAWLNPMRVFYNSSSSNNSYSQGGKSW